MAIRKVAVIGTGVISAEETRGWDMEEVARERDDLLTDLLREKARAGHLP